MYCFSYDGFSPPLTKGLLTYLLILTYLSFIKIGPVTPEIARLTTSPFWTRQQKLAYAAE